MLDIINHTSCQVQLDTYGTSHTIRLDLGGDAISLRVPTSGIASRFGRRRWHEVAPCPHPPTRRNRLHKHHEESTEKTRLIRGGASPCRVKAYYKHTLAGTTILILPLPALDNHLSGIPDDTSLGDLVIPGTHQSLALHGWPVTKCQDSASTLPVQLTDGIRFFDIRLSVKNGILLAYHGPWPQLIPFTNMLISFSTFLADHPRETIITCIQQEVPSSSLLFSSLVRQAMDPYIRRGEWFLENRIPQMGEVRGKAVLMSRFGGSARDGGEIPWLDLDPSFEPSETHYYEGESFSPAPCGVARMGWKPERWPDSVLDGFIWHAAETPCRTQDWYEIYGFFNIPAKFSVLADHLSASAQLPPASNLTISFSSAASIPLAVPPLIANGFGWPRWGLGFRGVNDRLKDWLLDRLERVGRSRDQTNEKEVQEELGMLRGIIPMDFYKKSGLVELMVAVNAVQTCMATV